MKQKWYNFDASKGYRQKRPPIKKYVLVRMASAGIGLPERIAVGYRKDNAGQKQYPYFVTYGMNGTVLEWCDCLPEGFIWPIRERNPMKTETMTIQVPTKPPLPEGASGWEELSHGITEKGDWPCMGECKIYDLEVDSIAPPLEGE